MEDVLLNFSFFLSEINVLNAGFFLQYMFYIVIKTEGENDRTVSYTGSVTCNLGTC